jgi:uncharacterized membrane protein YhaH (DUF805 family)
MNLLLRPWRHYADFSGRSRRSEYFLFVITYYGVILAAIFLGGLADALGDGGAEMGTSDAVPLIILVVLVLGGIVPNWAVSVRRMHDQNKSGWFVLISFIPYIGGLIYLVLCFLPGTEGENDYGWDPRHDAPDRTAEIFS